MPTQPTWDESQARWVAGAAIADLVDNSGGTADGTLADVPVTYSESTTANNFADLAAKVNQILAALRVAGVIAD